MTSFQIQNNSMKIIVWVVLLCTTILSQSIMTIYFISGNPAAIERPVYSSLRGGRLIYIKVSGHDPNPNNLQVSVGPYPCLIPSDGVTDTFITCQTTDTGFNGNIYNQRVTLVSKGVSLQSSTSDVVHFRTYETPYLRDVFPTAGHAGSNVNFYGTHQISDLGDGLRFMGSIIRLSLGEDMCSRFDVEQDLINPNYNRYVKCVQSSLQEAGTYKVTELVVPGYANNSKYMRRTSALPEEYFEYTVLPTITTVSPNRGNLGGQHLTILGTGFSAKSSNNTITVDNNPCIITSATSNELKCTLAAKGSGSSKLATNSTSQMNGYFSGAGLNYARYNVVTAINTMDKLVAAVRTSNTISLGVPVEVGVRDDFREGDIYVGPYAQVWKGYFTAPATGTYLFRGSADDYFRFYLATTYGSTELPANPLLEGTIYQRMFSYYWRNTPNTEATVQLQGGKSYYLEAYHIDLGGVGFMNMEVEVPNSNTQAIFQANEVAYITTNTSVQPEVKVFSMTGGSTGTIQLEILRTDPQTLKVSYNKKFNVSYGCDASTFMNALNKFDGYSGFGVTVTRNLYDASNNTVATVGQAAKINYVAQIYQLRDATIQNEIFRVQYFDGFTGTFTEARTAQHSPLLSGTFTMSIGGVSITSSGTSDLPYDISESSLQQAIRDSKIVGFENVLVTLENPAISCKYSCTWYIEYKDYYADVPDPVVNGAGLSGGVSSPTIIAAQKKAYSSRLVFSPIDYRFLNTHSSSINVQVNTNGVPAACTGDCSYTFNTFTEITALSYSGSTLTFGISDPTSANFAKGLISVSVGGLNCPLNSGGTLSALSCALYSNSDGSPTLVAGSVIPIITVGEYGIAGLASGVSPLSIPLVVTSVSVASGGNNGGYLVVLRGKGFPLSKSEMTITLCGNRATIASISNIAAEFYVPACSSVGSQPITVVVGSATNSDISFTFTDGKASAPSVISISPASANPTLKGVMEINGNGFGTNISAVQVFLSNSTGKIYQLSALMVNNTYIKVGLPGGGAGVYVVEVSITGKGDSLPATALANRFTYELVISSVSPSTGSIFGGTLLTITGVNFATDLTQTKVYVGPALNWFCTIESISTTQLTCRTPSKNKAYSSGTALKVVMETRLVQLNSCSGTCTFSYLTESGSPKLTSINTSSVYTDPVLLTGSNLVYGGGVSEAVLTHQQTGNVYSIAVNSSNSSSLTFTVHQNVIAGPYFVQVRNALGSSDPIELKVKWNLGSNSWKYGGSLAGSIITIGPGSGYPSTIDFFKFNITLSLGSTQYPIKLISCCASNSISLQIPQVQSAGTFSMVLVGPTNTNYRSYAVSSSYTPTGSIASPSSPTLVGSNTIRMTATNAVAFTVTSISLISLFNSSHVITLPNNTWTTNGTGTSAVVEFTTVLSAGTYRVVVDTAPYGFLLISNPFLNVSFPTNVITSNQQLSFLGGSYTISATNLSPVSYITVEGLRGDIIAYSSSSVTYEVPALVTALTQSTFKLKEETLLSSSLLTPLSDQNSTASNASAAFDGKIDSFYGSPNALCFLGVDAGNGLQLSVSRIRFFPNVMWTNVGKKILHAQFQGSNDMATWNRLARVDQTVRSGWNILKSGDTTPYRYIRFSHNSTSACNLAELQLYGILLSNITPTLTSTTTDVLYRDGFNSKTFPGAIEFRQDRTAVVNSVSPRYGDIGGGYTLSLIGENLNAATATVTIDGVVCAVTSSTATTINCLVGARSSTPTKANTFQVKVGSSKALLKDSFLYVLKWSSKATWGVDIPPIDRDLVYIPQGTTLLVDQNTPILEGIVVEGGTIVFSDDLDLTVQAGFITLNGGHFVAGTEQHPHVRQLTFIMHGDYYGKQQPMFGNKGIGCMNCKFQMYGSPRSPTWTRLAATVSPGDSSLTVSGSVDWKVGEQIVVASTSFMHEEAERKTITAVSGTSITVSTPFLYKHVSVVEVHGSDKLAMQAEVGLLTRNIKMRGDSSSEVTQYGSHLMLTGLAVDGFEGYVGFTQFSHCGQPQILGRYCIHFHMAGDIPTSFARGNAVHDSFARVITIHGVHYLTVEDNVGFRVKGHNFFVEDGIQTHNMIRRNLAISSLATTRMLQTDTSVASFWITHPTNDFVDNVAAGSDFYGIWYEIKQHPDGPSATLDVCPMGNALGNVTNNTAHSNIRFGLRIFILAARLYPCDPVRNDTDPNDPWAYNPSQESLFSNFTVYKNLEDGVLSEETGNVVFDNFIVAQNYHAGLQLYIANYTKEPPVFRNSAIIGVSSSNAHSNVTNYTSGMSAAITGRTGTYSLLNVRIYNFPQGSVLLQTCRFCDNLLKYTNLGTQLLISQLQLTNITGNYLFMIGLKRDVIRDLDGSLSQAFDGTARNSGTIMYGFPHVAAYNQADCPGATTAAKWDNAIMCGPTKIIRRVFFANLLDSSLFDGQMMHVAQLATITDKVSQTLNSTMFTSVSSRLIQTNSMEPSKEMKKAYGLPFLAGKVYNLWWGSGIDFTHLSISSAPNFASTDPAVIFKFNYTSSRELFEVGPMRGGVKQLGTLDFLSESTGHLDASSCTNGAFFHNNTYEGRMLEVCQSGKNRTAYEYTEVNPIICRYACPVPSGEFVKEDFLRKWSNASQWPNSVVPQAGDNVTVSGNWTVIMDVDPNPLGYLVIDGDLISDDTRDVNITAKSIHIRAGSITAGSSSSPFLHRFTIQLNGNKSDSGYYIDPVVAGNKYLVVTGRLNLYGNPPSTTTTHLTQSAPAGSNTIHVGSSSGWSAGDSIVLSPSFSTRTEYQSVTVQSVNADGSITLGSALKYAHFGDSGLTVNNNYGQLDTRTKVGHVSRNIQIRAGPGSGWGFTTIVYGYNDGNYTRIGSVQLWGVQFASGGQLDTTHAPLYFLNSKNGNVSSSVKDCSFINCQANCIYVSNSYNLSLTNNVLYNAWVFGAQFHQIKNVTFDSNLIIGVSTRSSQPEGSILVACVYVEEYLDPTTSVSLRNNFCLGSTQHGFALPFVKCSQLESNPMGNNTVGSALIGFIFNTIGQQCQAFSYAKAYACTIGQICGPPGISSLILDHFLMADNGRSVTLKIGSNEGGSNHTAFLHNSYISAISRPGCSICYGSSATICSGLQGVRMFTASANGETMPAKFGTGFDVVCKQPVFDSKSYIVNTTFDSFRQSYSGLPGCTGNFALKPHSGAFDQVGNANLFTSPCSNCDLNSYLESPAPNPAFLNWFGGCGDLLCTGFQNYLVQDHTGQFLGSRATIIPNNSVVATNETGCTFSSPMNAYFCQRDDFAVLEYQNVAADFKSRIMWPVNLTYDRGNYTTITNAWREWDWLGSEPLNHRFGRFVSIVRLNQTYNMTFASKPPEKLQVQIQKRTPLGNNSNYLVIRLHYPLPNSIRVSKNGVVVDPILVTEGSNSKSLNLSDCGSNSYFYNNYTTIFVVTEAQDCLVTVYLEETVQLTTHFAMDINDFFSNGGKSTKFIDRLCAVLEIKDTSRVKIVGVYSGSTVVVTSIFPSNNSTETPLSQVQTKLASSIQSGAFSSAMAADGVGSVLSAQTEYYSSTNDTTPSTDPSTKSEGSSISWYFIVAGAGGVAVVVGLVMLGVCLAGKKQGEVLTVDQENRVGSSSVFTPNVACEKDTPSGKVFNANTDM